MKFLVQVICVSEAVERREEVFEMEREHLTMETLGLGLGESKALLRGVQEFVVAEQVAADLERRRSCPDCGKRHTSKAQGHIKVKTVFGRVEVPNPRWHRCPCQSRPAQIRFGRWQVGLPDKPVQSYCIWRPSGLR